MAGLAPGTTLADRFEILGLLGRGGMAAVYLAEDELRGERVAVKVLHAHLAGDPSMVKRLQREVRAAARVRHPAALVAHELHEADGHTFLSLPYHPGQTLSEQVAGEGPMTGERVRALGVRLAEVLAEAHRGGVLHRDVNPNNVMVGPDGEAVLMDLGRARLADAHSGRSTGVLGTTGFAPPEVFDGQRGDPRSDLYGLGATLYVALTGRPPFAAETPLGVIQRQLEGDVVPPSELVAGVPADLEATVMRLLARDPEERPQAAAEVALSLGDALPPEPVVAVGRPALPPGEWTLVVGEKRDDKNRREALRVDRGLRPSQASIDFQIFLRKHVWGGFKQALGIPEGLSPEELLMGGLSGAAGLPREALALPDALLEPRFRLVGDIDQATAEELRETAVRAGFKAQAFHVRPKPERPGALRSGWTWTLLSLFALAVAGVALGNLLITDLALGLAVLTVVTWGVRRVPPKEVRTPEWAEQLPLAFGELEQALAPGHRVEASLAERVGQRLDALQELLEGRRGELLESATASGLRTLDRLRSEADALAAELGRLEDTLHQVQADLRPPNELAWLSSRRSRLQTRRRASEEVDEEELHRLTTLLEDQAELGERVEALEARRTAATTRLMEVAAAASRARHDLERALGERASTRPALDRLLRAEEEVSTARKALAERRLV